MVTPYLFQFATEQPEPQVCDQPLIYDATRKVTVLKEDPQGLPAVIHPNVVVLGTKKNDREKGEDQKDRWA